MIWGKDSRGLLNLFVMKSLISLQFTNIVTFMLVTENSYNASTILLDIRSKIVHTEDTATSICHSSLT